ncbi:MAG: hypothetical protein KDA45_10255 [Planctomycetales bacterium]|nr:hypothetical protein [Planctomycetales bacterium]
MNQYGALCDEFFVNMHLGTEMDLPQNRESVLHFFEQVQKKFPRMANFYARERGEFCLEEEKHEGQYRWVSIEPHRLCSGAVNPESVQSAVAQHQEILHLAPYALSISHLDCESLSFMLGFDYTYRGNQNELLAEALGMMPALEKLVEGSPASILSYEPAIQLSLDDDCKTQCRLGFETRTTAYQVRSGEFSEDQLSVYLTVRRYESLRKGEDFAAELLRLAEVAEKLVDDYLVDNVLRPLQQTIALK